MTSTPATPDPRPTRLVARSRDDLVAMVPVVLGFVPSESVTLLTFDAARVFHARVDLPHDAADDLLLVEAFLEPARRHRVRTAAVVVHTPRPARFEQVARPLLRALLAAGVRVVDVLRADLGAVWCLDCDEAPRPGRRAPATPARGLAPVRRAGGPRRPGGALLPRGAGRDPGPRRGDARAAGPASARPRSRTTTGSRPPGRWPGRGPGCGAPCGVTSSRTRGSTTSGWAACSPTSGSWPSATAPGSGWTGVGDPTGRAVARRRASAPTELCGPPAGVLAYAAWLRGDGALAWCAVERGLESGRTSTWSASSPSCWCARSRRTATGCPRPPLPPRHPPRLPPRWRAPVTGRCWHSPRHG